MADFFAQTLDKLLDRGVLRRDMKILVVCGGMSDREVLLASGFSEVVVSNIEDLEDEQKYAPYQWSRQDAEQLEYLDGSFDFCLAHSGLHHCGSPHRALLEMYRVAREGVLVFEPLDSIVTRLGVKLGLGQSYEVAAVAGNRYASGGLRNTPIPNYVYRWTEREVEKTIRSFAPQAEPVFLYFYGLRIPWERSHLMKLGLLQVALKMIELPAKMLSRVYPRASNNFAFAVLKPEIPGRLHPWLKQQDGKVELDQDYLKKRYN